MAKTGNELLAEALAAAKKVAIDNIVNSASITKQQRTFLIKHEYLKKIIRGWYLLDGDVMTPNTGESALWNESLWAFIGQYIIQKFGKDYYLSPEASLDLHTGNNALPKQLVIFIKGITPRKIDLPNDMSLLLINAAKNPYRIVKVNTIKIHSLESALVSATPLVFRQNPLSLQIAIRQADSTELAQAIIKTKNQAAGNRLIGAYFALDMKAESHNLQGIMESIGFQHIKSVNPFNVAPIQLGQLSAHSRDSSSAIRIRVLWQQMRQDIIHVFSASNPTDSFKQRSIEEVHTLMEQLYVSDAYHSLSIEGYQVTTELIERVSKGSWSPETLQEDRNQRDALAAKGYFDAFTAVKETLSEAHKDDASDLRYYLDVGITQWYRALFQPCVSAGLVKPADLAGYRKGSIYIRGSRHVPPASEQLMDCMDALKALIVEEESYVVKAILGHLFLGYIHPFPDGNGRTARFLMNFLFILGGYDWVLIRNENRDKYLDALEQASVDHDVTKFAEFVRESMVPN